MSEDPNPVQIFISYARDDDLPPPDAPDAPGFVKSLHTQLSFEFTRLGHPRPKLWRDTKAIEKADQFAPRLVQAINDSSLLLIVLSNNWMASEWCRHELETFAERWRGESGLRERIIVASKRFVDRSKRPSLLQGQTGYDFFRPLDDPGDDEEEFFVRGKVRDPRYYDRIAELARALWRRAEGHGARSGEQSRTPTPERRPLSPPNGRTIYVAKPASDMQRAYDTVVKELVDRGFAVVPDPAVEIPRDSSALALIDEQLATAEISVHLLGEKSGFTPEDQEKPIVDLQLARAAERADNSAQAGNDNGGVPFLRFVWAPKVVDEEANPNARERDPYIVLINFTKRLERDKVIGDNISKFVLDLIDYTVKNRPQKSALKPVPGGSRVYLYHAVEDSEWAADLASGFESREVDPVLPVFDGPPAEVADFHRKQLLKCDAVVLCWAAASEVWARAHADELRDWAGLGRNEKFAYRSLIAGPPPGTRKNPAKRMFFSRNEIDVVIDLTATSHPTPEALDPLFTTSA